MNNKFKLGALFPDKKTLELDIKTYEKETFVNFVNSSTRQSTSDAKDLVKWMKEDYPQLETEFIVLDGEMVGMFIQDQDPEMKSSFHRFPGLLQHPQTSHPKKTFLCIPGHPKKSPTNRATQVQ